MASSHSILDVVGDYFVALMARRGMLSKERSEENAQKG